MSFLSSRSCTPLLFSYDSASPAIYTLSLHDALPIYLLALLRVPAQTGEVDLRPVLAGPLELVGGQPLPRSEEHTSELQSHHDLVCRLLLEKKNKVKAPGHNVQTVLGSAMVLSACLGA